MNSYIITATLYAEGRRPSADAEPCLYSGMTPEEAIETAIGEALPAWDQADKVTVEGNTVTVIEDEEEGESFRIVYTAEPLKHWYRTSIPYDREREIMVEVDRKIDGLESWNHDPARNVAYTYVRHNSRTYRCEADCQHYEKSENGGFIWITGAVRVEEYER